MICAFVSVFVRIEATSRLVDFAYSARDLVQVTICLFRTRSGSLGVHLTKGLICSLQGITEAGPQQEQLAGQANGKAYPLIEFRVRHQQVTQLYFEGFA